MLEMVGYKKARYIYMGKKRIEKNVVISLKWVKCWAENKCNSETKIFSDKSIEFNTSGSRIITAFNTKYTKKMHHMPIIATTLCKSNFNQFISDLKYTICDNTIKCTRKMFICDSTIKCTPGKC